MTFQTLKGLSTVGQVVPNSLIHGDCLEAMKYIADESIDMILCDLPYGWIGTTACKWDTIIPFDKLWAQYERVIKPNGAIVLTAAQPFTSALVMSNPKLFKHSSTWIKSRATGFVHAHRQPLRKTEEVLFFYKKQPTYNPQGLKVLGKTITPRISETSNERVLTQKNQAPYIREYTNYPNNVLNFISDMSGLHPTQKPVALFEYLIRTYTNPGDVVLDNCAGSGTTAVAAEITGRRWICMEQEEKYVTTARARVASLQTTFTF